MEKKYERFGFNGVEYSFIYQPKKIKRVTIRVLANLSVVITYNYKMPLEKVNMFIRQNMTWIEERIKQQAMYVSPLEIKQCMNLKKIWMFGKLYNIVSGCSSKEVEIIDDTIYVNWNVKDIKKTILEKYSNLLVEMYNDIYNMYFKSNYPYAELQIKKMKSCWGKCKFIENKIVLNTILVQLSFEQIRHIIIHEFVHLKHPNHSKAFYDELAIYISDHKKLRNELKKYNFLLLI